MDEADPLLAVEPAVGDWPSASGAAEWLSACRSVKASSSKLRRRRRYARRRQDRRQSPVSLDQFRSFSWRCRVARRPIRENATLRTQAGGGTRRSARDLAAVPSRRQLNGHSCDQRIRRDVEAALSPDNIREISGGSTFFNLREVIMTMSEYEERFRPPAPSLHQTFAEVRGPNRGGKQRRRLWVTAALLGVMTITSKAALHHSSHANGSGGFKTGIQTGEFFHWLKRGG